MVIFRKNGTAGVTLAVPGKQDYIDCTVLLVNRLWCAKLFEFWKEDIFALPKIAELERKVLADVEKWQNEQ